MSANMSGIASGNEFDIASSKHCLHCVGLDFGREYIDAIGSLAINMIVVRYESQTQHSQSQSLLNRELRLKYENCAYFESHSGVERAGLANHWASSMIVPAGIAVWTMPRQHFLPDDDNGYSDSKRHTSDLWGSDNW